MSSSSLEWSSLDPLDATFLRTLQSVQSLYTTLPRSSQIRVEQWCTQLSQECIHNTWRKSRNLYSELLLQSVHRGVLCPPFHKLPDVGPLPQLPPEITLSLIGSRKKSATEKNDAPLSHIPKSVAIWSTIFSSVGLNKASKKEKGCELLHPPLENVEDFHPSPSSSVPVFAPAAKLGKGRADAGIIDCGGGNKWFSPSKTPQWESNGVFNSISSRDGVHSSGNILLSSLDTQLASAIEALANASASCVVAEADVKVLKALKKSEGGSPPASMILSSTSLMEEPSPLTVASKHVAEFMAEETLLQYVGELRALRAHVAQFLAERRASKAL